MTNMTSTLLDYAAALFVEPRTWPPCYPLETEWLFSIFSPCLTKTPVEAFEAPSVIAFFQDMHDQFVSDWLPEVQGLHDHLTSLIDGVADANPTLFTQATDPLLSSINGSTKVPGNLT